MPNSLLAEPAEGILTAFFHEIVEWFAHSRAERIAGRILLVLLAATAIFLVGRLAGR